jgi:hypothetical protein
LLQFNVHNDFLGFAPSRRRLPHSNIDDERSRFGPHAKFTAASLLRDGALNSSTNNESTVFFDAKMLDIFEAILAYAWGRSLLGLSIIQRPTWLQSILSIFAL